MACYVYRYSFPDPCAFYARSYYAPLWCDLCNTSAHNVSSCPYFACYAHSDSSLLLTQCTGLEVGESFGLGVSFNMDNALCGLGDTIEEVHNLVDTPLEGYRDLFVRKGSSSLSYENVIPNLLEHPMFLLLVHNRHHHPLSILMMRPMIFLNLVMLILIWVKKIMCLIYLVGIMKILSP